MAMKVSVSFKQDELEMYEFLTKQLSPSIFIKELLKREMVHESKPPSTENTSTKNLFNF